MSDSTVSKTLLAALLLTSILIRIVDQQRKRGVRGWMRLLVEVVCCRMMVPMQGCPWLTWSAIKVHQLEQSQA